MNHFKRFEQIVNKLEYETEQSAREKVKAIYEGLSFSIMMDGIRENRSREWYYVCFEKDCINLLYEDIIIRQWVPNTPEILYLFFEEGTKLRLTKNAMYTLKKYFDELTQ